MYTKRQFVGVGVSTAITLGLVFMFGFAALPALAQTADDYGVANSGNYCPKLSITMQRGARDVSYSGQVSELQKFISDYYDIDPDEMVTGFFGRITQGYVQQFQREQGLPTFGIAGSMTRAAIAKVCTSNTFSGTGQTNPNTTPTTPYVPPTTTYVPPTNTQVTPNTTVNTAPSISVTKVSLPYIYVSYANIANTELDLVSQSSGGVVHNQGITGTSGTATIQVQQSLSPGYYFFRVLKKYGDGGTLVEGAAFQIGSAQPSLGYSLRILAGNPGDTWYEGSNIDGLALTVSNSSLLTQTLTFPTTCKYTYTLTNESGQVVFDLGSTQYCATSVSSMTLNSGQEYSFPITHQDAQFHLKPGKYVMKATVKDSYGTGTAQTYFYVKAVNPTCTLSAKPYMPATGEYTTLSWSSKNATSLMWQQDNAANLLGLPAGMLSTNGAQSFQVSGKSGQLTTTLLVYGANGSSGSCNTILSIQ